MDPVHAAWLASHQQHSLPSGRDCARCAAASGVVKVRDVVSNKFTAWDSWTDPSQPMLCPACAWAYRTPRLRAEILLVYYRPESAPVCRPLDPDHLFQLLVKGSLHARDLVSLPIRAGRRHVLPLARFGQVCVDGTNLSWSHGDARRLQLVAKLREQDRVPWSAFTDPAPPWRAVSRSLDPTGLMRDWDELRPWRESGLWLQVALSATHPTPRPAKRPS